ncbi:hypothetical protein HNQ91_005408 [Filimonas zeae]|uniref:Uncharacterized protein n=1 Tax=Filimonas zeae TaxID=1737353 RepID=A0A917MYY7_9BACT|nr:hypothetical protein [Filimonas zeae]MDR6342324.1 hypothetical protein [Filimonas zeae]GGH80880.1 hypothetical protein GCM10011379_52410 [Filimonas zeae]
MKKTYNYFIPSADAELVRWLNNFKEQIITAGPAAGLTAAQVTELQDKAQKAIEKLLLVVFKKQEYKDAILSKNQVRTDEVGFIANAAVILKRSPLYTSNIGGALGIITTTGAFSKVTLQPAMRLNVYPQYVEVGFNKRSQTGVSIYSRLHGTEEWIKLDDAERTPYKDVRPLQVAGKAEVREYMCRCYTGDEYVGQNSEVYMAVFGGVAAR